MPNVRLFGLFGPRVSQTAESEIICTCFSDKVYAIRT